MSSIVALDTETTGIFPERRAYEVGLIVAESVETDRFRWFVDVQDLDLGNADPFALRVGKFYQRHPQMNPYAEGLVVREVEMLTKVERLTRSKHLLGAVPNFDADVLDRRMRAHGILPSWHYRLRCAETLACGYLRREVHGLEEAAKALGIEVKEEDRHTALGDATLALAIWNRVMADVP